MLGTVHVLPSHVRWRSAAIDAALAQAESLVFELDPAEGRNEASAAATLAAGRNPPGVTLSSRLTPEDRGRFAAAAKKVGLDPVALEPFRPWIVSLWLGYGGLRARGATPEQGVEAVLEGVARQHGLAISGLETTADHIRFFQTFTEETEMAAFRQTLSDVENGKATLERIDQLWARGEAEALGEALIAEFNGVSPQFYEVLIKQRNIKWVDQINAMLASSGDVFVAVGAAHMAGPDGLPALLRARGILVEGP
jgi:uncharacterized protein YbaP (TraB family)